MTRATQRQSAHARSPAARHNARREAAPSSCGMIAAAAHHGDELDGLVVAQVEKRPAANRHDALGSSHAVVCDQHLRRARSVASAPGGAAWRRSARGARGGVEARSRRRSGFQGSGLRREQLRTPCGSRACRRASARTSPAGPPRRSPPARTRGRRWLRGRCAPAARGGAPPTQRPRRLRCAAAAARAPPAGMSWPAARRQHRGAALLRGEAKTL